MSDDKNLPPSEHKIREARKKGQVTVTQDLAKLATYVIVMQAIFSSQEVWLDYFSAGMNRIFQSIATHQAEFPGNALEHFIMGFVQYSVMFAVIAALVSVICTLGQTRFNVAPKAYEANLQKLNPGNNLKNLVSMQKIMMAGIGLVKVGIIASVAWSNIDKHIPEILKTYSFSHQAFMPMTFSYISSFVYTVMVFVTVTTLLDYVVHFMQTYKSLKMDIKEMKDEYKQNEGDPHAKSHRKQEARAMANEPFTVKKDTVNAVVVNPDHLAVVLSYEADSKLPPLIVRMASDQEAREIRDHALRKGILVVRFVRLARGLYENGEENNRIPPSYVQAVALIIRMAMDMNEGRLSTPKGEVHDLDAELQAIETAEQDSPAREPIQGEPPDQEKRSS